MDVSVLLVALSNDNKWYKSYTFGSAIAEYVQTCLFIYDLLSFIYCLVSPYKHIYVHTWKIEEGDL